MKKRTVAIALGLVVLLANGCGGGSTGSGQAGDDSSAGQNNPGSGGSGQLQDLLSQIDVRNDLSGKTVKVSDPQNTSALFKENYFVFSPNKQVKYVENSDSGDQRVYEGTYVVKTYPGFGNVIEVSYTKSDGTSANTMIYLDDNYHVKDKQLNVFPAHVYTNENNGLVMQNNKPVVGANALTVTTPGDVKGYTISSNNALAGGSGAFTVHQTIVTAFKCDGSFTETITNTMSGQDTVTTTTGTDVSVDADSLTWSGTNNNGESTSDSIGLDSNHQIIAGKSCYQIGGSGTGEECANNLYVKTITKDTTCQ